MNIDDGKNGFGIEAEVEKWLDQGIAQYAKADPRAGLEGRLLARLAEARREAQEGPSGRLRWWGTLAIGTAVVLPMALILLGRIDQETIPQTPVAKVAVPPPGDVSVASGTGQGTVSPRVMSFKSDLPKLASGKPERGKRRGAAQSNAAPKMEQFPSPRPLSEQEQILMSYVAHYPEKAALIAQAQAEALERDREEQAAEAAKDTMD